MAHHLRENSGGARSTASDFIRGPSYKGYFKEDHYEGIGFHSWSDGRSYRGQWKNSKIDGFGVYTFPDRRIYEGQYKEARTSQILGNVG